MGQWEQRSESQLLARDLAVELMVAHLVAGHDVVVPQFLGRPEFIERMEGVAWRSGAVLVEVLLFVEPEVALQRFQARRKLLAGSSHPENDVADSEIEGMILGAAEAIASLYGAFEGWDLDGVHRGSEVDQVDAVDAVNEVHGERRVGGRHSEVFQVDASGSPNTTLAALVAALDKANR